MLLWLRKILFYLLFLAYLLVTPSIIFHGLGYGVNPAEGEIYKTGLVSIVTEPKGATIFMEDKKFSGKTPAAIGGLLPGQYRLRLSKKGFEPWQKTIEIIPEKATRLEPVILLPQKAEGEFLSGESFWDLVPKANDFKVFALEDRTLQGLAKMDLFFRKKSPVLHEVKAGTPLRILDFEIKKDSNIALFKIEKQGRSGFLLVDLEREKIIADLTQWVPEKSDRIDWDARNPEVVYFLKNGQLTAVDLEQGRPYAVGAGDILGFGVRQKRLYYLKKDFSFWEANARGGSPLPLSGKEGFDPKIFNDLPDKSYEIDLLKRELFQKELFLFKGDRGALLSNWPPYQLAEEDVRGTLHSIKGDSEKILYWTEQEIGVLDFSLKNEEEEILPSKTLLYRSGSDLRQAFWAYDNTHVVFLDENKIFLLEAGDTAPYLVHEIGRAADKTHIIYNDRHRTLYYLSEDNHQLVRQKITE